MVSILASPELLTDSMQRKRGFASCGLNLLDISCLPILSITLTNTDHRASDHSRLLCWFLLTSLNSNVGSEPQDCAWTSLFYLCSLPVLPHPGSYRTLSWKSHSTFAFLGDSSCCSFWFGVGESGCMGNYSLIHPTNIPWEVSETKEKASLKKWL